ncbi:MAG: GGDEF domain-containing protein [Clostridiales bacterium]|jgi:diguanylate cyclase (GGDEF)-like protein|nr:GGDEF domain-containing protein [Clostridiales bacterium]
MLICDDRKETRLGLSMLENNHKTIGVFVTRAHEEYQDLLCRAISHSAYELGYNVAIFSNYEGSGGLEYNIAQSNIANILKYEDLSGVILLPDTMLVKDYKSKILNNIKKYSSCPVVSVRQSIDEYQNVLIEDDTVLDEIIEHFINHHKFTKLNFLTGPENNPVSWQRLNTYKRILSEHGIPIEEDRILFGDFWKLSAAEAVEKWLANPDKFPEAIICANDYMAISVCNALAQRGIMVPRDVAVSGCDNIEVTKDFSPPITTVGMPVADMGKEAVEKIHRQLMGISQEDTSYLKFVTHIRESCGCEMSKDAEEVFKRKNHLIKELEERDDTISQNAYMSIDLTGVTMMEDLSNRLSSYTYLNSGFSSFYMCLYTDWDLYESDEEYGIDFSDREVSMEVGMKRGQWLQKVQFEARELLPSIYLDKEPQTFYFNMLHHNEKCYGYTAISFEQFQAYKSSYQGWLTNVCNALENIKIHSELNRLVYRLEDISIKDELTGLYNRRALHTLGQKYLEQSIRNKSNLMVFSADMDNLKYINDIYGHTGGDIALKAVAKAMMNASEDDEICIRLGGDEFSVIGVEYDIEKMNLFLNKFEGAIRRFNMEQSYDFKISISIGWSITKADEETTLEECLSIADKKMYIQKYEKKRRSLGE